MGRYSGKCDFSDSIDIHGVDNILKSTIKIRKENGSLIKLDLQNEKDLIPYYPYLVSSSGTSNGVGTFHLDGVPWIQREIERYGIGSLKWYYRKELNDYCEEQNIDKVYPDYKCDAKFLVDVDALGSLYLVEELTKYSYPTFYIASTKDNKKTYLIMQKPDTQHEYFYHIVPIAKRDIKRIKNDKVPFYEIMRNAGVGYIGYYNAYQDKLITKERVSEKIGKKWFPKEKAIYKER